MSVAHRAELDYERGAPSNDPAADREIHILQAGQHHAEPVEGCWADPEEGLPLPESIDSSFVHELMTMISKRNNGVIFKNFMKQI